MALDSDERLALALKIIQHLRRCLNAFIDGEGHAGRRDIAHWMAQFNASTKYWRYPLIPAWLFQACASLGMPLPVGRQAVGGANQLTKLLQLLFEPLKRLFSDFPIDQQEVDVSSEFDPADYQHSRFGRLNRVFTPLIEYPMEGVSLYLHGSLADLTFTPFSDIDDLVLLSSTAWKDEEHLHRIGDVLTKIARAYQDIDPYQHHGHWLVTELDLLYLTHQPLPAAIFHEMRHVSGSKHITFRATRQNNNSQIALQKTIQAVQNRLARLNRNGGLRAFELKELVGELALLPTYLFQTRGEMLNKPQAIARAGLLFSPQALKALEWATFVRQTFAPMIKHPRVTRLKRIARKTCPRRHQAEAFFRRWSPWVANHHPLGVNPDIHLAIHSMVAECQKALKDGSP